MSDARCEHGLEDGEAAAASPASRDVRRLQAETSGLIALALTDRMQELVAAWTNRTSAIVRQDVGQGLELSMEVQRKDHARVVELSLYRSDDGSRIGAFQMRDADEGFIINHRWVDADWRGGTGTLLLRKMEQFAQRMADETRKPLACIADIGQADVIGFFTRNGYAPKRPEELTKIEDDLRSGEIIVDDGYMYPKGTDVFRRTGRKSFSNVRIRLAKKLEPSPLAPRRKRFGLF